MPERRFDRGLEIVITGVRIMLGAASDDAVSAMMAKFAAHGKSQDEKIAALHERLLKLEEHQDVERV